MIRFFLDAACGIPSIVYGAVVFLLMVAVGQRASLLWGCITVALFITPLLARAMDEVMQMVPTLLKEASYGLGATDFETLLHVVTRQALPGLVTAVLLAFGRGIGDAASVLFTAGYTDRIPVSITGPCCNAPACDLLPDQHAAAGSPVPRICFGVHPACYRSFQLHGLPDPVQEAYEVLHPLGVM